MNEPRAAWPAKNPFLDATLGLLRVASRVERLAERTARPWDGASAREDDVLYAVLGALSLARRVNALAAAVPERPAPADPRPRARARLLR